MRFVISCTGSYGDVYPFIAIGKELRSRGHEIIVTTSGYFEAAVADAGLAFQPVGTRTEYEEIVRNPDLTHPQKGLRLVADTIIRYLPEAYRTLDDLIDGNTILLGSTLAFAAKILHEKRGTPWVPIHLAPSIFRSNNEPPRVVESGIPDWLPDPAKSLIWWLGDRLVVDPAWAKGVNAFRSTLGLSPISRIFKDWIHSPELTIGMFPEWFAKPQPGWPMGIRLTDFPLYDQAEQPLNSDVIDFLDAGDPPVVFVSGTATSTESAFFTESVRGCAAAGLRGLVLTRFPDQLPDLPRSIRHFNSIPFSQLLPRCAAIVHHGGVGTLSQALKTGAPQIVRPYGFDQFDNAARLVRLGVAREVSVKAYASDNIARQLTAIVSDDEMKRRCSEISSRMTDPNPIAKTCDLLLHES